MVFSAGQWSIFGLNIALDGPVGAKLDENHYSKFGRRGNAPPQSLKVLKERWSQGR
jgi:hypothetical protein